METEKLHMVLNGSMLIKKHNNLLIKLKNRTELLLFGFFTGISSKSYMLKTIPLAASNVTVVPLFKSFVAFLAPTMVGLQRLLAAIAACESSPSDSVMIPAASFNNLLILSEVSGITKMSPGTKFFFASCSF